MLKGGSGGQDNEIGSEYRARVGAFLATAVLLGDDIANLGAPVSGVPRTLSAEADTPVDDLVLQLQGGGRVCFQAKHEVKLTTGPTTPLGKAVRQFVAAHRSDPESVDDALVLVFAKGSKPVGDLSRWCDKLRFAVPGVPSKAEADAYESLRTLLKSFGVDDEGEIEALSRRIYFWQTDPRDGDSKSVLLQRLRHGGLPQARLSAAYDALVRRLREIAQHRAGDDVEALVRFLSEDFEFESGGSQPASIREAMLLDAYRREMVRRGRNLSALGVPAPIGQIPLSAGDAVVRVNLPLRESENVPTQRTLGQALRRRGRIMVVGAGGSGKSTALRVLAAELAADPVSSPLPLLAHCKDVVDHDDDPLRAAIALATSQLPRQDADLLESAIRRVFARGETAILLDGLDEISGRERFAAEVSAWLGRAPRSTEAVLTTRSSGQSAAAALDWPVLHLVAPRNPMRTIKAIVGAVGDAEGRDDAWRQRRRRWASDRLDRDESLSQTPLIVVLLGTLAATAEGATDLPESRVAVLSHVLDEIVERWEVGTRLRDKVVVGDLGPTEAIGALRVSLSSLARASLRASSGDLRTELANELTRQFGQVAPMQLQARVTDAVHFWTASGLFEVRPGGVRAQLRPLAEAALAQHAEVERRGLDEALEFRRDSSGWGVLGLIAHERHDVRREWARRVANDGNPDELIALVDAHLDGAALDSDEVAELLCSPAILAALGTAGDASRVVEALLALDPSRQQVRALREAVSSACAPDENAIIDALLCLRSCTLSADDSDRLTTLYQADRPQSHTGEDGIYRIQSLSTESLRTLQEIAIWLAGQSRADAEVALGYLEGLRTPVFLQRLTSVLADAGHTDLASQARDAKLDYQSSFADLGNYSEGLRIALVQVADAALPRVLNWAERRRVDELSDLWASMNSGSWNPRWIERRPDVLDRFQKIALALGGFDAQAVAAQAAQILREQETDPDADYVLRDGSTGRPLVQWAAVTDPEQLVQEIVEILGLVPLDCVRPLTVALSRSPCRGHAFEEVQKVLPTLRSAWRLRASRLAFTLVPDIASLAAEWSQDDDVRRREATAAAAGVLLERGHDDALKLTLRLLDDSDRGVQVAMVDTLVLACERGLAVGDDLRGALERLEEASARAFECECGAEVGPNMAACPTCSSSAPTFAGGIDQLLGRPLPTPSHDRTFDALQAYFPKARIRQPSPWD